MVFAFFQQKNVITPTDKHNTISASASSIVILCVGLYSLPKKPFRKRWAKMAPATANNPANTIDNPLKDKNLDDFSIICRIAFISSISLFMTFN
ncbi:MAG TPA: hypothetical protein DEQ30_07060 [Porphyromonadaceae bacterium]|nr:hypothetical protein [Porphyromonadaceae bacterium]